MQPEQLCNDLLSVDPEGLLHCADFPSRLHLSGVILQLLPELVSSPLPADVSPGRPLSSNFSKVKGGLSPATFTPTCMER